MKIITTSLTHHQLDSKAELISYLNPRIDNNPAPGLILVPGGSYTHIDLAQAEKVALRFSSFGFQVSILRYSLIDEHQPLYPYPLLELAEAMHLVRQQAQFWQINPKKITLVGLSVGGHIVSNYNNLWASDWMQRHTDLPQSYLKPWATILGYPVITPQAGFPEASVLPKWTDDEELIQADHHVNSHNAPTFIWATSDDSLVSVRNSVKYFSALQVHGIPTELHLFTHGPHGMALADQTTAYDERHQNPRVAQWVSLALTWLEDLEK